MERSKIVETCREVIYECVPDMEGTPLYEDTVINTDTAIDSMGFTMIICRLEARRRDSMSRSRRDSGLKCPPSAMW